MKLKCIKNGSLITCFLHAAEFGLNTAPHQEALISTKIEGPADFSGLSVGSHGVTHLQSWKDSLSDMQKRDENLGREQLHQGPALEQSSVTENLHTATASLLV